MILPARVLYAKWSMLEQRKFHEWRENERMKRNWDAHFERIVRETSRRIDG